MLYEFDDTAAASQALEIDPDALEDRGVADYLLLTYLTRARLQFHSGQVEAGLTHSSWDASSDNDVACRA